MKFSGKDAGITSYALGVKAEDIAADFLIKKKYKILERRYKTKFGEVDLIAQQKSMICFVEVKARNSEEEALLSVTPRCRKRVENAALLYLSEHPEFSSYDLRFDVVAISRDFHVLHLDNAWEAYS